MAHNKKTTVKTVIAASSILWGDLFSCVGYFWFEVKDLETLIGFFSVVIYTLVFFTGIKYAFVSTKVKTEDLAGTAAGLVILNNLYTKTSSKLLLAGIMSGFGAMAFIASDSVFTTNVSSGAFVQQLQSILPQYLQSGLVWWLLTFISILAVYFCYDRYHRQIEKLGILIVSLFTTIVIAGSLYWLDPYIVLKVCSLSTLIEFIRENFLESIATIGITSAFTQLAFFASEVFLRNTGGEGFAADAAEEGIIESRISAWILITLLIIIYCGMLSHVKTLDFQSIKWESFSPLTSMYPGFLRPVVVISYAALCLNACQTMLQATQGNFTRLAEKGWFIKVMCLFRGNGKKYSKLLNYLMLGLSVFVLVVLNTQHSLENAYGLTIAIAALLGDIVLSIVMLEAWKLPKVIVLLYNFVFTLADLLFVCILLPKLQSGALLSTIVGLIIFTTMMICFGKERKSYQLNN